MTEKLKPCPFCGRKMVFHKNTYTNKYGKQVTEQYYMHEDYDINKEESCILDDIDMPFTIGAGDARPDTGYIGEYGEKWNRRIQMAEYIEKPDMQYILHIKCDKNVEKRLIDFCLESVVDVFEDTGLTTDVQPVAHAEWIGFTRSAFHGCDYTGEPIFRDTTVWKCSHCGRNTVVRDNFCPNCGARMDGEQV